MQAHRSTAALLAGTGLALALTAQAAPAATLVIDYSTAASVEQSAFSAGTINTLVTVSVSRLADVLGDERVVAVTRVAGTRGGNAFGIYTSSTFAGDTGQAFRNLGFDTRATLELVYPQRSRDLSGYKSIDVLWWADHVNPGGQTKMSLALTSGDTTASAQVQFGSEPTLGVPDSLVTTSFLLSGWSGINPASVSTVRLTYEIDLASDTIFASISAKLLPLAGGTVVPLPAGVWLLAAGAAALFGLGVARSESSATRAWGSGPAMTHQAASRGVDVEPMEMCGSARPDPMPHAPS